MHVLCMHFIAFFTEYKSNPALYLQVLKVESIGINWNSILKNEVAKKSTKQKLTQLMRKQAQINEKAVNIDNIAQGAVIITTAIVSVIIGIALGDSSPNQEIYYGSYCP